VKYLILCIVFMSLASSATAQDSRSEVNRLFRQASSGEIRYQSVVKPSKDSLIAMADSASKYLVEKLTTTDAREKVTLVEIFRGIGKSATRYLVGALVTENKDQLRTTSRCLAEVKDTAAISHLLPATKHQDFTVRAEAVTAIGKSGGGAPTANMLEPVIADSIDIVRKCVMYGLGLNKSPSSIPVLITSLNDESFVVRLTAYDALVSIDSIAHTQIVAAMTNSKDQRERVLLLRLVGQLGINQAKDMIQESLLDSASTVRGWAVWSLARVGDKTAKWRIEKLSKFEQDVFVLSQIGEALSYLSTSKSDE